MSDQFKKTRNCLKLIRDLHTLPSDILPNGKTASEFAFEYILAGKKKRFAYKKTTRTKKMQAKNTAKKERKKKRKNNNKRRK